MSKKSEQKVGKPGRLLLQIAVPLALFVVAALLIAVNSGAPGNPDSADDLLENGDLVIPAAEITETAAFYPVRVNGTVLEVLAVRAPDGTVRTAFNTCQICFDSGRGYYVQNGEYLVCQNCGNPFHTSEVEVTKGGCNPVPIFAEDKTVDGGTITISREFLTQASAIFENWKI